MRETVSEEGVFAARLASFKQKKILMLQGPPGPFFRRFAKDLERIGATVYKINFNGGDWVFFPSRSKVYRGTIKKWPTFLRRALIDWDIDLVFLFGDMRKVHESVFPICEQLGVAVFTFEEGYLRPNFVTLEAGRTNGHSSLPDSPIYYMNQKGLPEYSEANVQLGYTFYHQAFWTFLYHFCAFLLWPFFPRSRALYHRGLGIEELVPQVRSFWQKAWYALLEKSTLEYLTGPASGKFFLVPLQVATDSQVTNHSPYASGGIRQFIKEVIDSFARRAPDETCLVFKHHPRDRGYNNYSRLISQTAREKGLEGRVFYIHDLHLPTLLNHTRGVVLINSTVGLSAMEHGRPVKNCGKAIYDMQGLVFRGALDDFWEESARIRPDKEFFDLFRRYLIATRQLAGNFYKKCRASPLSCGMVWTLCPESWRSQSAAANCAKRENKGRHI